MHAEYNWLDASLAQYARAYGRVCATVTLAPRGSIRLRVNPSADVAMSVAISSDCPLLAADAREPCMVEYLQDGRRLVRALCAESRPRAADAAPPPGAEFVLYRKSSCAACRQFDDVWSRWCADRTAEGVSCRAVSDEALFPDDVAQVPAVVNTIDGRRASEPYGGDMVNAIRAAHEARAHR